MRLLGIGPIRGRLFESSGPGSLGAVVLNPPTGTTVRAQEAQWLMADVAAGTSVTWLVDGVSVGTSTAAWGGLAWTPGAAGTYSVQAQVGSRKSTARSVTATAESTFDPAAQAWVKGYFEPTLGVTLDGSSRYNVLNNQASPNTWCPSLTQGTAAARPYQGKMRGRTVMYQGKGTSERLPGTTAQTLAQTWHILAACRTPYGPNVAYIAGQSTARLEMSAGGTFPYWPRTTSGNANVSLNGPTLARSTAGVASMKAAGASGRVWWNGSAGSVGTIGTNTLATGGTFGIGGSGASGFAGSIGDVYVLQGATDQNRTDLETHVIAKYRLDQASLSVSWCGDSISVGDGSTDGDGYRSLVSSYMTQYRIGGKWWEAIGPNEGVAFIDDSHWATSGVGISYLTSNFTAKFGSGLYQPDVISLCIGTNNVRENGGYTWVAGTGVGSTYADWLTLMALIHSTLPSAKILVWLIPPLQNSAHNARAVEFNANITAGVATLKASGYTIEIVDAYTPLAPWNGTDQPDGVHPSDTGYPKLLPNLLAAMARIAA